MQRAVGSFYGCNDIPIQHAALSALLPSLNTSPERSIDTHILVIDLAYHKHDVNMVGARVGLMEEARVALGDSYKSFMDCERAQTARQATRTGLVAAGTIVIMMVCQSLVCIRTEPLWYRDVEQYAMRPGDASWKRLLGEQVNTQAQMQSLFTDPTFIAMMM